jgi:hypothetical protein
LNVVDADDTRLRCSETADGGLPAADAAVSIAEVTFSYSATSF